MDDEHVEHHDSALDRERLRGALALLEKQLTHHSLEDKEIQTELLHEVRRLSTLRVQAMLLVVLIVLFGGAVLLSGRWLVRETVRDLLIGEHIIEIRRAP